MKSRLELINEVLEEMRRDNPGLDAVAVVSSDGMPVASLMKEADELKVSAMAATLHGVAEQVIKELRGGDLGYVAVTSGRGILIIKSINQNFVLVLLVGTSSRLGYALWQAERSARRLNELLSP